MDVIEGQRLESCSLLLTSRPSSAKQHEDSFDSVISVKGFTEEAAEEFTSHILQDQKLANSVLGFSPINYSEDPLWKCPMLPFFMCYLVQRGDNRDLFSDNVEVGEIYWCMIEYLHKSYITTKPAADEEREFQKMLHSVGKVA